MSTGTITRAEAEALWAKLDEALTSLERTLPQIIATRAWEPLGYETFHEAWSDRRGGTFLYQSLRAEVVTTLMDENMSDEEIRTTLGPGSGVTIPAIRSARVQRKAGVPVGEITVKEHTRKPSPQYAGVAVRMPKPILRHYHRLAEAEGRELTDIVRSLLAEWAGDR